MNGKTIGIHRTMGKITTDKPFKTNKIEWITFILMNLFAPPTGVIVGGIVFGWYGVIGSLVLFYGLYLLWKHVGKYSSSLLPYPNFAFGKKRWRLK